jgi:hypothetical protein
VNGDGGVQARFNLTRNFNCKWKPSKFHELMQTAAPSICVKVDGGVETEGRAVILF